MKKWVGAGLVGLGVVALGGPYFSGKEAQTHYHQMVDYLNQQGGITVVTESYDKGYWGSDAVTFIRLESADDEPQEIRLSTHFSHGVYSVKAVSHILFDETSAAELKEVFGDQPPLELTTTVNLLGDAQIEARTPEVDYTDPENGQKIAISEFFALIDVASGYQEMNVEADWPGMVVSGIDGEEMSVSGLTIKQSGRKITERLWSGSMTMSLDSVVGIEQGQLFEVKDIRLSSLTEESGNGRIDSGFELMIDNLNVNGEKFSNQKLAFSAKDLAITELDALIAGVEGLEAASQMSDPQQQAMAQMEQMALISEGASALLSKGLKVDVSELFVKTPKGNVNGSLAIEQPESANTGATGQPPLLLQATKGSFSFQVPVQLVNEGSPEMQQQLQALLAQNLVVRDGDVYKIDANLANMVVNVNGTEFPLPPLM